MTLTLKKNTKRKKATKGLFTKEKDKEREPLSVQEQIRAVGFEATGHNTYQRNGHALDIGDTWLTITDTHNVTAQSASEQTGVASTLINHPGPWRAMPSTDKQGRFHKVFEVPTSVLGSANVADAAFHDERPMQATLQWAIDTADGHRNGWVAPEHGIVVQHLKKTSLTVQAGAIVRETLIDHGEHHLAFRCPVLTHIPDDLPNVRREWLEALLQNAQKQWRLVRFGVDEEQEAVIAEVDLTGVPNMLLESFVPVAVDALRWSVSWLAKSAAVIVDVSVDSVLLAAAPSQAMPEKGVPHAC